MIILLEAQIAKSNQYKKIIDTLQNFFFTKQNQPQQSINKLTLVKQIPTFVYNLSSSFNNQRSVICMPQPSEIGFIIGKLTKALPDLALFIDEKDLFINQLLSKIQSKFKIN